MTVRWLVSYAGASNFYIIFEAGCMDKNYEQYAESRLDGEFGEMSSWRFVCPYVGNKRFLDIGCSDGLYLKFMSKSSQGIEQVPALAEAEK